MKEQDLKSTWITLVSKYTQETELPENLWKEIEYEYSTKDRHYHGLSHLKYMIDLAFKFEEYLEDMDMVLFSIFYHDIIYKAKRKDNEEKSSEVAANRLITLGVSTVLITKCQTQILATKNHTNEADNDTKFLVDFDLAILGDSPESYIEYSRNIRKEYSMYPDFLYNNGRKKVLQHFLSMDRIFKTTEFYVEYEKRARENMKDELNIL